MYFLKANGTNNFAKENNHSKIEFCFNINDTGIGEAMKKWGIGTCNIHTWSSFFHMTAFILFLVIQKVKK